MRLHLFEPYMSCHRKLMECELIHPEWKQLYHQQAHNVVNVFTEHGRFQIPITLNTQPETSIPAYTTHWCTCCTLGGSPKNSQLNFGNLETSVGLFKNDFFFENQKIFFLALDHSHVRL